MGLWSGVRLVPLFLFLDDLELADDLTRLERRIRLDPFTVLVILLVFREFSDLGLDLSTCLGVLVWRN